MKVFSKYDVPETSYHFYSERIDLHFCDDPGRKYWRDGAGVLPSRLMFKDYSCACNYKNILFYHPDALSDLAFISFLCSVLTCYGCCSVFLKFHSVKCKKTRALRLN